MKQISFSKIALIVCLLCAAMVFATVAFGQDTIKCRKVKIANHVGISMKTGEVLYAHPRWTKTKSGFIVKQRNGLYLINGKEYKPGNNKPLKIRK